ncbi:hypothetical protein BAU15_14555 [Enterococcus sp. JM4C]|uniref:glucosaminidase domain-containing protein n=1 Tax=Candidatus Enterococcus huntleyi TaxID=1857217 RepID=UPI00137A1FFC|nr:glucosaminidase domain-containing protein [Enterococcus sp. JM4C]KAF1296919.1 hypothetical protein BAU15_14555 [Enterococcus sp. JM4C]
MSKRNSLKFKQSIAVFSVAAIIFTQSAPAFANVENITDNINATSVEQIESPEAEPVTEVQAEVPANVEVPADPEVVAVDPVEPVEPTEPVVPETPEVPETPAVSEAPEVPAEDPSTEPEAPVENSSEPEQSTETTESSTTDSSSSTDSSTESSTTTDSTSSSDTSSTESSTTDSSSSSTNSSSTESSSVGSSSTGNTTTPSSSATTTPSSSKETPANPSGTATGSDTNSILDRSLQVDSLTDSDLNGYELPLLSSLDNTKMAAVIAESLKQLNKPYEKDAQGPDSFDNVLFTDYIYSELFTTSIGKTFEEQVEFGTKIAAATAKPGDLLFWESDGEITKVGIYLGEQKVIFVGTEAAKEEDNKVKIATVVITDEETKGEALPAYAVDVLKNLSLNTYGEKVVKTYAATLNFAKNPTTENFVEVIGEDARKLGLEYDVFASVMIAQAILESGSGSSGLASAPHYNLFGIKGSFNGKSAVYTTNEDDGNGNLYEIKSAFRSYSSYRDSLSDYVKLLRGGISGNSQFYKGVWRSEAKNYLQATEALTGKYATDTQYSNKLNSIIAAYNLTRFDEPDESTKTGTQTSMIIQARDQIPTAYREKMIYADFDGVNYNTSGSYPVGQCTWYVYNRFAQLRKTVDEYMGNGGEWGAKGAALGYEVTSEPTVGYAISFHPGVAGSSAIYGHVAFVEAIGPDGILISEGNVVSPDVVSYRVIPMSLAKSDSVDYIAPK